MDGRLLVEIKKWTDKKAKFMTDIVVLERTLTIFLNDVRLVSLSYLPEYAVELTFGFLFSEGIIDRLSQIKSFHLDGTDIYLQLDIPQERVENFLHSGEKNSGCGSALSGSLNMNPLQNKHMYSIQQIIQLMQQFIKQEGLFRETGGVHSSALAKENTIHFQAEDIGRHNAVDKVIGMTLQTAKKPSEYVMLTSGRISSEIVKKAIRAKIPLLASHSAPTSEAIRLGWNYGVIILGFTRGNRCSVYTFFDSVY